MPDTYFLSIAFRSYDVINRMQIEQTAPCNLIIEYGLAKMLNLIGVHLEKGNRSESSVRKVRSLKGALAACMAKALYDRPTAKTPCSIILPVPAIRAGLAVSVRVSCFRTE